MKDRVEIYSWKREIQILRARMAGASEAEAEASVPLPKVAFYALDVSIDDIQDPEERAYFMNLPTSFALKEESIDRLRDAAGRLLRESQEYQSLLRDPGGSPPQP
jgi:NTE family protein